MGCHHSQHRILYFLTKSSKTPSQRDVAVMLGISPAAVAVALTKMQKNNLIERTAAKNDNRIKEIHITEKGRNIIELSENLLASANDSVFKGFDYAELVELKNYLEHMRDNLIALNSDKPCSSKGCD